MNTNIETIDEYLATLPQWQVDNLSKFREIINNTSNDIDEQIKWGVPAFVLNSKVIFTMAAFKSHTKYNFILNGALLDDQDILFNNGLDSPKSRGIDLTQNQTIDTSALQNLISKSIDTFNK